MASAFPLSFCLNGALVVGLGAFRLKEQLNMRALNVQTEYLPLLHSLFSSLRSKQMNQRLSLSHVAKIYKMQSVQLWWTMNIL